MVFRCFWSVLVSPETLLSRVAVDDGWMDGQTTRSQPAMPA